MGRSSHFWQRLRFVILLILAAETGLAPAVLFLNRPRWLMWMAIAPACVGLGYAFKMRAVTPRALTFRETIGVYYTTVFELSASGLLAFLMYGAAALLVSLLGGLAHIQLRWEQHLAWWAMVVVGTIGLFGNTGAAADLLIPKLFPKTGIGNPPLFPGITGGACWDPVYGPSAASPQW